LTACDVACDVSIDTIRRVIIRENKLQHASFEVWLQVIIAEATAIARSFAYALGANCVRFSARHTSHVTRHTSHVTQPQVRNFGVEHVILEHDEPNM
jgi:triosephosphate isomerase